MPKTWSNKEFKKAVKTSTSKAQVMKTLNLIPSGGNYKTVEKFINQFGLCTKHFTGQAHSRGKNLGPKKDISFYLIKGKSVKSSFLKSRLLKEGFKDYKCESCLRTKWAGGPIPLELDHIDGDHLNNELINLRVICPNCHALTDTYRGRNKK